MTFERQSLKNKRILITHPFLYEINGATNVALELAEFLQQNGAHVTIYTNIFENPIKQIVLNKKLRVETASMNPNYKPEDFDYVWINSQTFPISLLRNLADNHKKRPKFIFMHMSAHDFCPDEMPYIYKFEEDLSSLSLFVSEEAFNINKKNYEKLPQNISFYRNPAPTAYTNISLPLKKSPKKLLVVDNRPCEELIALRDALSPHNISIDYIGQNGDQYKMITERIISRYDGVITIGKTVQYCLVAGVPVYVYGAFGGPGWLTKANITSARKKNFSGRGFDKKNTSLIIQELIDSYSSAASFYHNNKEKFQRDYLIDNVIPMIFKQADNSNKHISRFTKPQIESLTNLLRLISISFSWRFSAEKFKKDYLAMKTSNQQLVSTNASLASTNASLTTQKQQLSEIINSRSVRTWLKLNSLIKGRRQDIPEIILVMCVYNEERNMKKFLNYIKKYIDGIVVVDDNSSDNTVKILKKHKKLLSIINTKNPHIDNTYNEKLMREKAIKEAKRVAKTSRPFVLCIDPDERPEKRFLQDLHKLAAEYNNKDQVITIHYRELWNNINTWRSDGIWQEKTRPLFFQLSNKMTFSFKHQYHVPWAYDEIVNNQTLLDYNIYHLKMIKDVDREKRKNLYNSLDPNAEIQHIGYNYLNDKKGLSLQKIDKNRAYDYKSVPKYYKES